MCFVTGFFLLGLLLHRVLKAQRPVSLYHDDRVVGARDHHRLLVGQYEALGLDIGLEVSSSFHPQRGQASQSWARMS